MGPISQNIGQTLALASETGPSPLWTPLAVFLLAYSALTILDSLLYLLSCLRAFALAIPPNPR